MGNRRTLAGYGLETIGTAIATAGIKPVYGVENMKRFRIRMEFEGELTPGQDSESIKTIIANYCKHNNISQKTLICETITGCATK